jgi:hypothetical protein
MFIAVGARPRRDYRAPHRVAEVGDVGVEAGTLGVEHGDGCAEGNQGGPPPNTSIALDQPRRQQPAKVFLVTTAKSRPGTRTRTTAKSETSRTLPTSPSDPNLATARSRVRLRAQAPNG